MKELENNKDSILQNRLETVDQQKIKIKKLLAQIMPENGHKVFEYNFATGEIKEAEFVTKEDTVNFNSFDKKTNFPVGVPYLPVTTVKSIVEREDCVYVPALNKQNVIKRLKRLGCYFH